MNSQVQRAESELRRRGVASAAELAEALAVSQPTVSRALSALPPSRLHRIGKGRGTRYALRARSDDGYSQPLYRMDESAEPHRLATLHPLLNGSWHVECHEDWPALTPPEFRDGHYPDWPWFLDDLRPRGFLGRIFAHRCADRTGAPPDPRDWSATHTVRALLRYGDSLPGAFVIGEDMLAAAQTSTPDHISDADFPVRLVQSARDVLEGRWPGSSAAGEQPKFTLDLISEQGERRSLLVKFSGDLHDPAQARRADLLLAEHLANRVLSENGIPAAPTEIFTTDDRRFLVADRFDRTPAGGRCAILSLHALNSAFGDINRNWVETAADLQNQGWLSDRGAEHLGLIHWFGRHMGNTDMHDGNASLQMKPRPPFELAPVYDMTPMSLSPRADGTLPDHLPPVLPPPPEQRHLHDSARELFECFRDRIREDERVSQEVRNLYCTG